MVDDAEKYKAEDDAIAARIQAKNTLEHYCFTIKNTIYEPRLKDSFTNQDKKAIAETAEEGLMWLEANDTADCEVIAAMQK